MFQRHIDPPDGDRHACAVYRVPLGDTHVALVDASDYERVSAYRWRYMPWGRTGYATTRISRDGKSRTVRMHRFILDAAPGTTLDHQNGDGLDNRRANLRYATASQNGGNRRVSLSNKCGFKGVYKPKHTARWNARITHNRKRFRLGYFDTAEDAARAYNEAALRLFGTFARLNPV